MIFIGRSLRRADCDSQRTGAQNNGLERVPKKVYQLFLEPTLAACRSEALEKFPSSNVMRGG